ncbi:R8 protein [Microbotryomycetes sp. JL221]|nr:R8 protein [Microbotryomycetes sp. JL221]
MFYSTDILTRRRGHGFGIFWLAATLGQTTTTTGTSTTGVRTSLKRLTRKEILGCKIVQACERLIQPEEPLALRLSSNLLCGIARVFQHQYTIYYSDVSHVHQSLKRAFSQVVLPSDGLSVIRPSLLEQQQQTQDQLETTTTTIKSRHHQINLPEDPDIQVLGWNQDFDINEFDYQALLDGTLDLDRMEHAFEADHRDAEGASLIDSGIVTEGSPASIGMARRQVSSLFESDLARITLHEPHMQEYEHVGEVEREREEEPFAFDQGLLEFGQEEPGLLEGQVPELDDALRRAGATTVRQPSSVSGRYHAGISSSVFGGPTDLEQDLGGFEAPIEYDAPLLQVGDALQLPESGVQLPEAPEWEMAGIEVAASERAPTEQEQPAVPSSPTVPVPIPAVTRVRRAPRTVEIDEEIGLDDDEVRNMRRTYEERMTLGRQHNQESRNNKNDVFHANRLVFSAPRQFGVALTDFWKLNVASQLPRLGQGKAKDDKKRKQIPEPEQPAEEDPGRIKRIRASSAIPSEVELARGVTGVEAGLDIGDLARAFEGYEVGQEREFEQDFGGEGYQGEQIPEVELGRVALEGSRVSGIGRETFPWHAEAVSSDVGGFVPAGRASSVAGTRVSLETPVRPSFAQRSRTASLAPSIGALVGAEHPLTGFEEAEPLRLGSPETTQHPQPGEPEITSSQLRQQEADQLEIESLKFLSFVKRKYEAQVMLEQELLFSDLAPLASSTTQIASAAFYHTLTLATKKQLIVEQDEPYGEIRLEVIATEAL